MVELVRESDAAVLSIRVHKSMKEDLLRLAKKKGYYTESEFIREVLRDFIERAKETERLQKVVDEYRQKGKAKGG